MNGKLYKRFCSQLANSNSKKFRDNATKGLRLYLKGKGFKTSEIVKIVDEFLVHRFDKKFHWNYLHSSERKKAGIIQEWWPDFCNWLHQVYMEKDEKV